MNAHAVEQAEARVSEYLKWFRENSHLVDVAMLKATQEAYASGEVSQWDYLIEAVLFIEAARDLMEARGIIE